MLKSGQMVRRRRSSALALAFLALGAVGCGGSGNALAPTTQIATPSPTPLPVSETQSVVDTNSGVQVTFGTIASGVSGFVLIQSALTLANAPIAVVFSSALPAGIPAVQSTLRGSEDIGATISTLAFFSITPSASMSFIATPIFSLSSVAAFPTTSRYYVGVYDSLNGWTLLLGPAYFPNPNTLQLAASPISAMFTTGTTYTYVVFSAQAQLSTPAP
jgi:hypothetical protein